MNKKIKIIDLINMQYKNEKMPKNIRIKYSLVFDYPLNENLSNELQEERIVKCKVSDGTNQCFIIKNVIKILFLFLNNM